MKSKESLQISQVCKITVYLRLVSGKSLKATLNNQLIGEDLLSLSKKEFSLESSQIILMHKGKEISPSETVHLKDKAIVHVIEFLPTTFLTIKLKQHLKSQKRVISNDQEQFQVNPKTLIIDFLMAHINTDEFDIKKSKAIESGRFININRTFEQERITCQTQIHLLLQEKGQVVSSLKEIMAAVFDSELKSSDQKLEHNPQNQNIQKINSSKSIDKNEMQVFQVKMHKSKSSISSLASNRKPSSKLYNSKSSLHISGKKTEKKQPPLRFSLGGIRKDDVKTERVCGCRFKYGQAHSHRSEKHSIN